MLNRNFTIESLYNMESFTTDFVLKYWVADEWKVRHRPISDEAIHAYLKDAMNRAMNDVTAMIHGN